MTLDSSILNSVKPHVNISITDDSFDAELINQINMVLLILTQLGIGNRSFLLTSSDDVWEDFLLDGDPIQVITYVGLKVRMVFDPPTSSTVLESFTRTLTELEYRLRTEKEDMA